MPPRKFVKKPVEIEAIQFNGLDDYLSIVEWMKDSGDTHALASEVSYVDHMEPTMYIHTPNGAATVGPGEWVARGVEGEFYPISNSILEATYRPFREGVAAEARRLLDEAARLRPSPVSIEGS